MVNVSDNKYNGDNKYISCEGQDEEKAQRKMSLAAEDHRMGQRSNLSGKGLMSMRVNGCLYPTLRVSWKKNHHSWTVTQFRRLFLA